MGIKASDLKVGDKIRLRENARPAGTNANLLTPGIEYEVIEVKILRRSVLADSVDINTSASYSGFLNLADTHGLKHMEKVELPKFKVGDRVRVTANYFTTMPKGTVTTIVSGPDDTGRYATDKRDRVGWRDQTWWTDLCFREEQLELVKDAPDVEVTKTISTKVVVPCASGDGTKLVLRYDPDGGDDGPCLDFEVEGYERHPIVDIEEIDTLNKLIGALQTIRTDFRNDTK